MSSSPSLRTLVALATYNEIENLPGLVDAILIALPEADILVVDDNSPDGTGHWCNQHATTESRLACLHRPAKLGLGSATLAAFRHAFEQQYDVAITMDADWSHDPQKLPELIAALARADIAIGSRYVDGGTIEGWPLSRLFLSRVMNRLSCSMLGLPVRDASGAFRAYRVSKLREIDLDAIRATGYAYLEEILVLLWRADATFAEVPIHFHQRRAGRSKINLAEAMGKIATLVRLKFRD